MNKPPDPHHRHRFLADLIRHAVRLYHVFSLSFRDVVLLHFVQSRRDGATAERFFKRLLKGPEYKPRVLITDKLKSYAVAKREVLPDIEYRESRYLNNRAENSHRPTRRRERQMQRSKSMCQAHRFLFAHAFISGRFRPRRNRMTASRYRAMRARAVKSWTQMTRARSVG